MTDVATILCPNCGHNEADDDGDCLNCLEPQIVKMTPVAPVKVTPLALVKPSSNGDAAADDVEAKPKKAKKAPKEKKAKPSQASILIELVKDYQKWHSPDGVGYISVLSGEHRENWPIKSSSFRRWWQKEYYAKVKGVCNVQALADATGALEGLAMFRGREYPVSLRVGECDGNIYIDLCDAAWRVVEISQTGWRVLKDSPVKFRRCKAMLPLPEPQHTDDVDELRRLLPMRAEEWPLVFGWMVAALRPQGPYPVLNLYAEQGAGKTTTARKVRALVDPNAAPMRSEPKEPRDLMIAANNGWVIALDNLSHLSPWMSDALCRLSTGGGFSTRTLYENDEETIFDAMRPSIITGIEELATRGDLLDRSLLVTLPTISEDQRRPEGVIWKEFNEARPRLSGILYDAVAVGLRNISTTTVAKLPRMADFALWVTSTEKAIGLKSGEFLAAYTGNRMSGNELAIEGQPIGKVLMDFVVSTSYWTGTASELLNELDHIADDKLRRLRAWPQTGRSLSGILKRLAPNLRAVWVEVELGRTKKGRFITLRKAGETCVTTVTSVTTPGKQGVLLHEGDTRVTQGDTRVTQEPALVTQEYPENDAGDDGDDEIPLYSDGVQSDLMVEEDAAVQEFLRS
jgi:hypothetical protein